MKTVGAAKFKEQCLALLDSLGPEGIAADLAQCRMLVAARWPS